MKKLIFLIIVAILSIGAEDRQQSVSVSVHFRPLHPFKPIYISRLPDTIIRTITTTVSTATACAKLVNVTGACRRRKGHLIDEPIVLTFDEDMEEIDDLFKPTNPLRYIFGFSILKLNKINNLISFQCGSD